MQPGDVLQAPGLVQHGRFHPFHLVFADGVVAVDVAVAELLVEGADPGVLLVPGGDLVDLVLELLKSCGNRGAVLLNLKVAADL